MKIEKFEEALRKDDFAIGDTFWIDGWEFEVVDCSDGLKKVKGEGGK